MQDFTSLELKRDCEAIVIPAGEKVVLPAGTSITITQTLGGVYTVRAAGGLFRIATKDADALGIEPAAPVERTGDGIAETTELDERQVWTTLKTCFDPEIPVNIVDLGLVYDLTVRKLPSGLSQVNVKMTLTAPGCGMGSVIAGDAQQKLIMLDGVEDATVDIVWDPPWHQSMITADGRKILGLE